MKTLILIERRRRAGWIVYMLLGCACMALGLFVALAWLLLAWGVGITLIVWSLGSDTSLVCGACQNPVAGPDVRMCPICRAELTPPVR